MFDVISIGSATLDVFIKSSDLKLLKTDEVFTGEAIIAPYGAKCEVEKLVITSGGGGTNTAVGFARLGVKAAVLARCGWDFAGRMIRKELKKEKADDSLLIQIEGDQTDYSTILIGPDGGRSILVYRGGTKLEKSVIDFSKLKTRWFYISSLEGNLDLLNELVAFAKKNKIKVAINPGRREIGKRQELLPILEKVDVLIVNREEAAKLVDEEFFDLKLFKKAALVSQGIVVVTKGAEGVYLFDSKDNLLVSDGFKVEMVDATGAGDGFGCGFVAGLVKGWKLEDALKLGISNGAAAVTEIGAKTGLLYERNFHNWLEKSLKMAWKK
ncbi:MAG TPA: carbohydrate kinase family protein [Nevskiaceae bacterium]|nr:carbohydrate kinase family protein [Nevskiaceae bacterium]